MSQSHRDEIELFWLETSHVFQKISVLVFIALWPKFMMIQHLLPRKVSPLTKIEVQSCKVSAKISSLMIKFSQAWVVFVLDGSAEVLIRHRIFSERLLSCQQLSKQSRSNNAYLKTVIGGNIYFFNPHQFSLFFYWPYTVHFGLIISLGS